MSRGWTGAQFLGVGVWGYAGHVTLTSMYPPSTHEHPASSLPPPDSHSPADHLPLLTSTPSGLQSAPPQLSHLLPSPCWQPVLVPPKPGSHQPQPRGPRPNLLWLKLLKAPQGPHLSSSPSMWDLSTTCAPCPAHHRGHSSLCSTLGSRQVSLKCHLLQEAPRVPCLVRSPML